MTELLFDEASIRSVLVSAVPDWEWFLGEVESENGWFRFPPFFTQTITNLKIENYPLLYESERASAIVFMRAFMSLEEIKELDAELLAASPEERGEFLIDFTDGLDAGLAKVQIPKTAAEQEAARKKFEALSEEERTEAIRFGQYFYSSFFPLFFQNLSLMVHGEKLTSLVAQAKAGNDDAFVKAVQIDRRILTVIPYFKDRYARAQADGDQDFYDKLAYRLGCPPYRGKIRHKSLWLTFALLDGSGLLNTMSHTSILRLCDESGVGGYKNRISEVKYLSKRIKEYREFQQRGVPVVP